MALESHGPDTFVGVGPEYPWGRVYGGQVVAQALRAAATTVDAEFSVHSLHAYFIRGGDFDEPIRYEVDRIRNGRSFVTRRVIARQSEGAILNISASFQRSEDEADVQTQHLDQALAGPSDIQSDNDMWTTLFDRRWAQLGNDEGRSAAWLKISEDLGADPVMHACALAYLSDDLPTDAVYGSHPSHERGDLDSLIGASLDHAIWFHRAQPVDDWQLHDFSAHGLRGGRGLSVGQVFTTQGLHVATMVQEVLVREKR
ncbi:MAG: thioesterase family protein [Acidobacteria bacterium]|nr:thioesterase family protein [Acidobacteriota bacterium]